MTVRELKTKARKMNVPNVNKLRKKNSLIWAIQEAEGNDACFSKIPDCTVEECCFRSECITK